MNLIRDMFEIKRILDQQRRRHSFRIQRLDPCEPATTLPPEFVAIQRWIFTHKSVSVDTLKNACDLWIPLATLGHVKLSSTTVGFLGAISSAAAILQIIDYSTRLSPS